MRTGSWARLFVVSVSAGLLWFTLITPPAAAIDLGDIAGKVRAPKREQNADRGDEKASKETKTPRPVYKGPKKRLGVMDMEVKIAVTAAAEPTTTGGVVQTTSVSIPPPADFGSGLTEMLTTALVESGRFIVLERKALADIQAEQSLQATAAFNPASAAGSGKLLGAQALVRGAVTEYTYKRSSTGGTASFLQGIGVGSSSAEAAVVLDIRLYDVATGQILDSVKAEGRAQSSALAVSVDKEEVKMSASSFAQTPLGHATRQAIEKAVEFVEKRMEALPWEGRIANLDEENGRCSAVYINAGSRAGLKEGDRLDILRPGRPIVDPETQVVIGRAKDKALGSCRIDSVTNDLAMATPLEGEGFQIGDVVRLIEGGQASASPTQPAAPAAPTQPGG